MFLLLCFSNFLYNTFHHPILRIEFPFMPIELFSPISRTISIYGWYESITYFYDQWVVVFVEYKIISDTLGVYFLINLKSQLHTTFVKHFFIIIKLTIS